MTMSPPPSRCGVSQPMMMIVAETTRDLTLIKLPVQSAPDQGGYRHEDTPRRLQQCRGLATHNRSNAWRVALLQNRQANSDPKRPMSIGKSHSPAFCLSLGVGSIPNNRVAVIGNRRRADELPSFDIRWKFGTEHCFEQPRSMLGIPDNCCLALNARSRSGNKLSIAGTPNAIPEVPPMMPGSATMPVW